MFPVMNISGIEVYILGICVVSQRLRKFSQTEIHITREGTHRIKEENHVLLHVSTTAF